MDSIKPLSPGVLADYAHELPRDRGILLEGHPKPVVTGLAGHRLELHAPHRSLRLGPNAVGGPDMLPYIAEHAAHPYHFDPVDMPSVLAANVGHAPFAAAMGALTGVVGRGPSANLLDLGAHLSVVGTLPGGAQAVAAAFFRRGDSPGTAHRVPVVVRDSLPLIGNSHAVMALSSPQGGVRGSYPLLQKAYAQFVRGDARAPVWEPDAATCADDTSTAQSTAHALYSLTGSQPTVRALHAGAPPSARVAQNMHLRVTLQIPTAPVVLIPHAIEGDPTPHAEDGRLPTLPMGDFSLVPGMPLAVISANAEEIVVFDPLRGNAHRFADPGTEQLLRADQVHRWKHFLTPDTAQQELQALDFPQRFAQTVPTLCALLHIPISALQTLNYSTVSLRDMPAETTRHRSAAVFESPSALLRHGPTLGVSAQADQRLRNLLQDSKWILSGPLYEPVGTLVRHRRPLLTLTRDSASRMFRSGTGETHETLRPLLDHLLDLPDQD